MQLSIDNLSKPYRSGVQALKEVSLTIETGMLGLLGPNGAGRSTLMRIIATLQEADSGSVKFDNLDVLEDKHGVRQLLGYLPQEFGLCPKVTAWQMIDHFATLKGIGPPPRRREVVGQLLQKTNLYELRRRRLGAFSAGMKQRFGIATAGLDAEERVRFHNVLSEIGENVIVILSTQPQEQLSSPIFASTVRRADSVRSRPNMLVVAGSIRGREILF